MIAPMSDGIDKEKGTLNLYELLPLAGDSLMVVNCGTHYEIRHHHWGLPPLLLTNEDIDKLRAGAITWN